MATPRRTPLDLVTASRAEIAQVYRDLGTTAEGLPGPEAQARLRAYGPNELPSAGKPSVLDKVSAQLRNLFNVLLLVAAALSFPTGSPQMGVAILAVVVFNIAFSILQERRAEKVIEALRRLIPANAKVLRDGLVVQVPVANLVPGDVFQFEEGDRVPADARLLTSFGVSVDQSILTGESALPERSADARPGPEVEGAPDCPNLLLAGTTIASGSGTALVLATGATTVFGRIVVTTREIKEAPSPLQRQLGRTARLDFAAAVAVGLGFLVISIVVRNLSILGGLFIMIAVAIDLVPEGLQITVTLALAIASVSMSKQNVVVRRLASVETLGSSTVICTDKTGTITTGQMTVRKLWIDGTTFDVTGHGYDPDGQIRLGGRTVRASDREDVRRLCEIAAFDNAATLTPPLDRYRQRWTAIGDTTDAALLVLSLKGGFEAKKAIVERPRVALLPFDSRRKMMTSVHRGRDAQAIAFTKGSAQAVLERSRQYLHEGHVEPLTPAAQKRIVDEVDRLAADAFRVLALAYRTLPTPLEQYEPDSVEDDLTFVGLVAIYDPPRPEVADAVLKARGAGVKIAMITGDHELTAEAIARRVGIITGPQHEVVTGTRLAKMSEDELSAVLDQGEIVFARTTPEQKHQIVKAFQAKGEVVAVTGDGVNDAPALAEADVGIAMGITGTDVARESADMVLLDDSFASIVSGIELGRAVFDNLQKFIIYVFTHNWAELMSFVAFVLLGAPLAIGVVQVLSIDLVMDIPPSLALTVEPPEPKVMERPPRGPKSRLFDLGALLTSAYVGIPVGVAAVLAGFAVWTRAGWSLGQTSVADPIIFGEGVAVTIAGIMLGQIGNLFAQRSHRESTFTLSVFRNRWLLPGLGGTLGILLAYIYVPFFQGILQTGPLASGDWIFILFLAPMVVTLEEARKLVARKVFPTRPIAVPAIAPATGLEAGLLPAGERRPTWRVSTPAAAAPIVLALFVKPYGRSAMRVGFEVADSAGSKVVVARIFAGPADPSALAELEAGIDELARAAEIPYEFVDIRFPSESLAAQGAGTSLERLASSVGSTTIVVPVERRFFTGKPPAWLDQLASQRVVLVRGPTGGPPRGPWPRRLLIPVLREFHEEPFDVAAAIATTTVVPEVDVVAARVIRMPSSVPLYSTYSHEALVDAEKELSFIRRVRALGRLRGMSEKVLLVREVARDLVDFAEEREVDAIILSGDWRARRRGFLEKEERSIASRAACGIIVVLPARSETPAV